MIDLKNLKNFDFNTLPVFLCVYKHTSILKASRELQLSSSNITHHLNKLRKYFNDPLFIRGGQGIYPTTFCKKLYQTLSPSFNQLCNFINEPKSKAEVTIYSPDGTMLGIINNYANSIGKDDAPKIIHYSLVSNIDTAMELFLFRKADIIITNEPIYSPAIECIKLYTIKLVLVCRKNHPRAATLLEHIDFKEKYSNELWVALNTDYKFYHAIRENKKLSKIIKDRKVVFESDSLNINMHFIENSDALGFVSETMLETLHPLRYANLIILPVPVVEVDFYINYRKNADSCVANVVEKLLSLRDKNQA